MYFRTEKFVKNAFLLQMAILATANANLANTYVNKHRIQRMLFIDFVFKWFNEKSYRYYYMCSGL